MPSSNRSAQPVTVQPVAWLTASILIAKQRTNKKPRRAVPRSDALMRARRPQSLPRRRSHDEVAVAPEKVARETGRAEVAVQLVDAIGTRLQFGYIGVGARIAVQPRQHFGYGPADGLPDRCPRRERLRVRAGNAANGNARTALAASRLKSDSAPPPTGAAFSG